MLAHGRLQRAVVDDHLGRGDARRARRLAGAAAASRTAGHLLRTRTEQHNAFLNKFIWQKVPMEFQMLN